MTNETSITYFYLLPFSGETRSKPLISAFFFLIYVVGVLINSSIITVIYLEVQLHKPMYLFICNLSIVDIFYTSVTVPKLLHMLLSGNHIVSSAQCYTQLYFFTYTASTEGTLLFVMAYDRYVAICNPLHYHRIMTLNMSSCHSNVIHQFFCDPKSLTKTICTTTQQFIVVNVIEILILAFIPLMCTFISYFQIFSVISKMKTKECRKKSFSTCSSHITIITIYYGAGVIGYLIPPYSEVLDIIFNTIYSNIIPMINPMIYSLQNSNIQSALLRLVRGMSYLKKLSRPVSM
ncbi:hypothetical protein GDO81_023936 [Engystomops pustulosus]|uniref:G-protein coupled receptors family 1 profile domain-containing protein n=1 Tax=Engystomops pustulosus TaxID=76066 RepID=A0AAV6ZY52_ENGPU|nr:hypothetical protein GDO81_023936 [Engystomops pustulosus]